MERGKRRQGSEGRKGKDSGKIAEGEGNKRGRSLEGKGNDRGIKMKRNGIDLMFSSY